MQLRPVASLFLSRISSQRSPPSTSSITRYSRELVSITSYKDTIFECRNEKRMAVSRCSLSKMELKSRCILYLARPITLTAYNSSPRTHLYTFADMPQPSSLTILYGFSGGPKVSPSNSLFPMSSSASDAMRNSSGVACGPHDGDLKASKVSCPWSLLALGLFLRDVSCAHLLRTRLRSSGLSLMSSLKSGQLSMTSSTSAAPCSRHQA
mmetsp:Transcript_6982/g.12741  ORF Transcript_6982/g.12741 Transcript_6982/m.12741 type:complete len:209 (-) Transcript_6982:554-1180(-)